MNGIMGNVGKLTEVKIKELHYQILPNKSRTRHSGWSFPLISVCQVEHASWSYFVFVFFKWYILRNTYLSIFIIPQ